MHLAWIYGDIEVALQSRLRFGQPILSRVSRAGVWAMACGGDDWLEGLFGEQTSVEGAPHLTLTEARLAPTLMEDSRTSPGTKAKLCFCWSN